MSKGIGYIIGDIHGCAATFRKMVTERIRLKKENTLYLIGDYIDRGSDSKGVLDFIMELKQNNYNVRPIMGNHEYMLLKSLDDEEEFVNWMKNGSGATLMSFGVPGEETADPSCIHQIPDHYIDFLCKLSYYEENDQYYFVHAGVAKNVLKPTDDLDTLFWTRRETYNRQLLQGRILIHGHTPVSWISIQDRIYDGETHVWNVDGGCVYTHISDFGNLIAVNLNTLEIIKQENVEPR